MLATIIAFTWAQWAQAGTALFALFAAMFWATSASVRLRKVFMGMDYNTPAWEIGRLQDSIGRQAIWNKRAAWMACISAVCQAVATFFQINSPT